VKNIIKKIFFLLEKTVPWLCLIATFLIFYGYFHTKQHGLDLAIMIFITFLAFRNKK